jgi:hypothetical protein
VSSNNTVRLIDFSNNQQEKEEFENELAVNLTYLALLQQTEQTLIVVVIPVTTTTAVPMLMTIPFSVYGKLAELLHVVPDHQ